MKAILPGATLGVLGGGQLGRMFVHAAQRMGYFTAVLDADPISPAGAVAHHHIQGSTAEPAALAQFSQRCDAITTEFENVSAPAMHSLAVQRVVSPSAANVAIAQNRLEEKKLLAQVAQISGNLDAAPIAFTAIDSLADITATADDFYPGLLKTITLGYDGKGQALVRTRTEASAAFAKFGSVACVLEQFAPLAAEASVLLARNAFGDCVMLPVARNVHLNGILASSEIFEGNLPPAIVKRARDAAELIAEQLDYVGVLCVEFFVLQDDSGRLSEASALRVNEIAPRPHNSGHWSMDGSSVSQFELQVRTLCNLPLVQPLQLGASVMLNLLGDAWLGADGQAITPDWPAVLALPGVALHLYGKATARVGRKMGHLTITAATPALACLTAVQVAQTLGLPYQPSLEALATEL